MWSVCRVHECFADVGVQGVLAGLEVCRLRVGGVRGVPVAGRRPSPTCSTASPLTVHTREWTFQIIDDQSSTLTRYTYQRALTQNTRTCLQFVFFISHNWLYKSSVSSMLPFVLLQPWRSRRIWKGARLDGVRSGLGRRRSMETQAAITIWQQATYQVQ